jgi:hypothetical protein
MFMITLASSVSFLFLLQAIWPKERLDCKIVKDDIGPLSSKVIAKSLMLRLFEDGFLTLSPLLLVFAVSNNAAGQFRIIVSFIKVAYKFFPFRYEILMRDVSSRMQSFHRLLFACVVFSIASVLISLSAFSLISPAERQWLLPLIAVSGAVASCLSVYPISCIIDARLSLALMAGLVATCLLTVFLSGFGFVLGFCLSSYLVMIASLFVIRKYLASSPL